MRRSLFNLAAAISRVLMLATIALWVCSYWAGFMLEHVRPNDFDMAWVANGSFEFERIFVPSQHAPGTHFEAWKMHPQAGLPLPAEPGAVRDWRALGFRWFIGAGGTLNTRGGTMIARPTWRVRVPLWFV